MNPSVAPGSGGQPQPQPRVCVIGAGPCGLTALKNLLAAGLSNIVCYDESEAIGGNWVFCETGDRTSVYFSTHIISSKKLSEFEDYPMPADYPDFPSHQQLRAYFDSYAAHFGLEQRRNSPHLAVEAVPDGLHVLVLHRQTIAHEFGAIATDHRRVDAHVDQHAAHRDTEVNEPVDEARNDGDGQRLG